MRLFVLFCLCMWAFLDAKEMVDIYRIDHLGDKTAVQLADGRWFLLHAEDAIDFQIDYVKKTDSLRHTFMKHFDHYVEGGQVAPMLAPVYLPKVSLQETPQEQYEYVLTFEDRSEGMSDQEYQLTALPESIDVEFLPYSDSYVFYDIKTVQDGAWLRIFTWVTRKSVSLFVHGQDIPELKAWKAWDELKIERVVVKTKAGPAWVGYRITNKRTAQVLQAGIDALGALPEMTGLPFQH